MKTYILSPAALLLTAAFMPAFAVDTPVDFTRARHLFEKTQRKETLL